MHETQPRLASQHKGDNRADLLPHQGERVLLIQPSVYDTRIHWPQWQQPTTLLRLATYSRHTGAEAHLIDALQTLAGHPLHKQRITVLDLDGLAVNKWRYGLAKSAFVDQLRQLAKAGWKPDKVYVECFATFWWEGAAEAIECIQQRFPNTRIILVGGYGDLAPEHAVRHAGADDVPSGAGAWSELANLPTDLSLYAACPHFAYISLGNDKHSAEAVIDEIVTKARQWKVLHFAFSEHGIACRFSDRYREVLELLTDRSLGVNFYAIGNIYPSDFVAQPDLAGLMRRAGYVQIYFADDRDVSQEPSAAEQIIEDYRQAAESCHEAGFPARTQVLSGGVCLGRPGESLEERARFITLVAHQIGSVILWPYQPAPDECLDLPLEEQNGKLFPFRNGNGYTYRDYLNVMGLATVLNSKYRTRTFDFLGDGLVARLFRDSIARRAWEPDPEIKGVLKLPLVVRP